MGRGNTHHPAARGLALVSAAEPRRSQAADPVVVAQVTTVPDASIAVSPQTLDDQGRHKGRGCSGNPALTVPRRVPGLDSFGPRLVRFEASFPTSAPLSRSLAA